MVLYHPLLLLLLLLLCDRWSMSFSGKQQQQQPSPARMVQRRLRKVILFCLLFFLPSHRDNGFSCKKEISLRCLYLQLCFDYLRQERRKREESKQEIKEELDRTLPSSLFWLPSFKDGKCSVRKFLRSNTLSTGTKYIPLFSCIQQYHCAKLLYLQEILWGGI